MKKRKIMNLPLKGKCHCGNVQFELHCNLTDLKRCNCSHCRRKGFVMTTAKLDEFKLISGNKYLKTYQWNTKIAKHFFVTIVVLIHITKEDQNPMSMV